MKLLFQLPLLVIENASIYRTILRELWIAFRKLYAPPKFSHARRCAQSLFACAQRRAVGIAWCSCSQRRPTSPAGGANSKKNTYAHRPAVGIDTPLIKYCYYYYYLLKKGVGDQCSSMKKTCSRHASKLFAMQFMCFLHNIHTKHIEQNIVIVNTWTKSNCR